MNPTYVRGILCTSGNFLSNSNLDFMDHRAWSGYLCYNGGSNYTINSKLSNLSYDIMVASYTIIIAACLRTLSEKS